jgi:hypothetical protein
MLTNGGHMTDLIAHAAALASETTVRLLPKEVDVSFASTIGYAAGLVGVLFALALRRFSVRIPIQPCGFYFGIFGGVVGAALLGGLAIFQ